MTEAEGAAEPREQGWWGPILAALLLLLLPATPLLRIVIPMDQTLLLLAPALAVCAVAGWRGGGRLPLALFFTAFGIWVLWQPGNAASSFALLARGWSAILAAVFGALVLAGVGERFLPRALLALAIAAGVGGLMVLIASGGLTGAFDVFTGEIARRSELSQMQWREMTGSVQWQEFVTQNPDALALSGEVDRQLVALPAVARLVFPALLALESLAALALAWALYHRVGQARLGPPLSRLREFRFNDALVWGIIVGLVSVVLPIDGLLRSIGVNLLVFFGALYALRGLGVLLWILAPGRWMMVGFAIFTLLFWHVVGVVSVAVGLSDTWFDWRRRLRPKSQRSE